MHLKRRSQTDAFWIGTEPRRSNCQIIRWDSPSAKQSRTRHHRQSLSATSASSIVTLYQFARGIARLFSSPGIRRLLRLRWLCGGANQSQGEQAASQQYEKILYAARHPCARRRRQHGQKRFDPHRLGGGPGKLCSVRQKSLAQLFAFDRELGRTDDRHLRHTGVGVTASLWVYGC
jgi:hypothetical protein